MHAKWTKHSIILSSAKVFLMGKVFNRLCAVLLLLSGATVAVADPLAPHVCKNTAGIETNLRPTTPSSDFVVVGEVEDGIVRHLRSGLEWRRCPAGRLFSAETGGCSGSNSRNWQAALQQAHEKAGGWRMPSINELSSIVEECASGPAVNQVVFPGITDTSFWSSTTAPDDAARALVINFSTGSDFSLLSKTSSAPFMLVRDAP